MKKIAFTLGCILLLSFTLSSCKKTYNCECTFSDGYKATVNSSAKMTNKDAVKWCETVTDTTRKCVLL
jgi:hypothetical protein